MEAIGDSPSSSDGMPLSQLVTDFGGELIGEKNPLITGVCSIDAAKKGAICFTTEKRLNRLKTLIDSTEAAAVVLERGIACQLGTSAVPLVAAKEPLALFAQIVQRFHPKVLPSRGISPLADVAKDVRLGEEVSIGAFCSVAEGVVLGNRVTLYPHVTVYPRTRIGDEVVIHSGAVIREDSVLESGVIVQNGAVIGADGFGYVPDSELGLRSVPQIGRVHLMERVEVGANSCIDRATLHVTEIGAGSKVDNLVQVGHNTKIGSSTVLCGLTGIAGSCHIGNQVVLGGHCGVADHVTIVDGCRVGSAGKVTHDLRKKGDYLGAPAQPAAKYRREIALLRRLPSVLKKLLASSRREP